MRTHRLLFPLHGFIILFLIGAVLGVEPSYDPALSYVGQVAILLSIGVYILLAHGVSRWGPAYAIVTVLMLAGTIYAGFFILQYGHQGYGDTPAIITRIGAITTLLPDMAISPGHPNAAATFLEGMIALGIAMALTRRHWSSKGAWVLCVVICLYAIALTFSRGAFIGLAASFCISLIALSRRPLLRLVGVGLLLAVALAFALTNAASAWALSRLTLYQNSLYITSDYLFTGIGLGDTFPLVYSRYGLLIQVPFLSYPHNLLLSAWTGQGLLGLVGLTGFIVVFYLFVWRVIHSARPRRIFHAAWLGVTVGLIHGLFDSRHYVEVLWLMPYLLGLAGLAAATGRMALVEAVHQNATTRTHYFPWRLVIGGTLIIMAGALLARDTLRAAWNTNLGALAETRADLAADLTDAERNSLRATALDYYNTALRLDPAWPSANRRRGNLSMTIEDYADAVPYLETVYASQPTNPAIIKGLGLAYLWTDEIDAAVRLFGQLDNPDAMREELEAWGWYRRENDQPLLSAYAYEAMSTLVAEPDALGRLVTADAYRRAGEIDRARLWYERVLALEPDHAQAQQALAEIDS